VYPYYNGINITEKKGKRYLAHKTFTIEKRGGVGVVQIGKEYITC
jgi:hypothetical protein